MSDLLDEIITTIETPTGFGIRGTFFPTNIVNLFTLCSVGNQHVFTIKSDGSVEISPNFTTEQAAKEFWQWVVTYNPVQSAIEQAKREERTAIVKQIEDQAKQWGIMRSMKMTNYSDAAEDLADLIRK